MRTKLELREWGFDGAKFICPLEKVVASKASEEMPARLEVEHYLMKEFKFKPTDREGFNGLELYERDGVCIVFDWERVVLDIRGEGWLNKRMYQRVRDFLIWAKQKGITVYAQRVDVARSYRVLR